VLGSGEEACMIIKQFQSQVIGGLAVDCSRIQQARPCCKKSH
jgi:hypothetical protein